MEKEATGRTRRNKSKSVEGGNRENTPKAVKVTKMFFNKRTVEEKVLKSCTVSVHRCLELMARVKRRTNDVRFGRRGLI